MPQEVIIGTSDAGEYPDDPSQEVKQEMPALSAVEAHVQRLRYDLCGDCHAKGRYASRVRIPASDLTRIGSLIDLLDQLQYWAIEEATTFVEEPSRLAETEAPEAVVACVCSGRPQLMTQALSVVQPMLHHPQTAFEVRRVVRQVIRYRRRASGKTTKSREEDAEDDDAADEWSQAAEDCAGCDPLLTLLAEIMASHAGVAPLLSQVVGTAAAVVQVVLCDLAQGEAYETALHRVQDIVDTLYETPLVLHIETAMRRFAEVAQLQLNGVRFFAAMVDLPTLTDNSQEFVLVSTAAASATRARDEGAKSTKAEEHVEESLPLCMADVVAHSDGVLVVLQRAMQHHRQLLALCRGVLHIWKRCAQLPSSRLSLLRHGVYGAALRQLGEAGPYTADVFGTAAEIVGCFIPLLDALQRRSLLLTLRGILQRRPQLDVVELVLALLVAVLTVVNRGSGTEKDLHRPVHRHGDEKVLEGASSSGRPSMRDPYAMYAMCPLPPPSSSLPPPHANATAESTVTPRQCCLQLSPLLWQPPSSPACRTGSCAADRDTWRFMLENCAIPQFVSGLRGYFAACEVVDEEDAEAVQRVCALADAVLSHF
ncbi:hypothetical protein ABL78_5616 [Leptomonas seymouri]|uniref:Uncharacterized protein n=1 Tax=Leptomonas seymouri TaxID=5684 RepID=A0A0N1I200_LEPSE|nr:hypothetical protein ABL78_5616 [Leptomonas seymouri]|eukprot:KPI85334.1 hypothetical protein ABL78_5616 [Leptomonas seymouri]